MRVQICFLTPEILNQLTTSHIMSDTTTTSQPLVFGGIVSSTGRNHDGFTSRFTCDLDAVKAIEADPKASDFAKKLAADFRKWKRLFPNQLFWLHKLASQDPKPVPATPLLESPHLHPNGKNRWRFEGKVVSTRRTWSGPHFDQKEVWKILVALPDGNKVWGTCPRPLLDEATGARKLTSVKIVARVQASDKDEHFGFFSFPKAG